MARPQKQTVEYFPHYASHGKTMFILETKYGNDGYAFWFKLLEMLAMSEGHYLKTEATVDWEYLKAKTKVSTETARDILDTLASLEAIDRELWEYDQVIWVQNFVDNLADVYKKRLVSAPTRPQSKHNSTENVHTHEVFSPETEEETEAETEPEPEKPMAQPKVIKGNKTAAPPKQKYADRVSMTEEEYGKLIELHGEAKTKDMITGLDLWKGSKGKSTKSDYLTILTWIRREEKEAKAAKKTNTGKVGNFNNFEQRDYDFEDLEKKLLGWD